MLHLDQPAHPRVATSMQLFGVGEAAFHRLFSSLINALAHALQLVAVDALLALFPHVPGEDLGVIATFRAPAAQRADAALLRVGVVLPVALAVGGAVRDQLSVGAEIDIQLLVIAELAFMEVALAVGPGCCRGSCRSGPHAKSRSALAPCARNPCCRRPCRRPR